MSIINVDLYYKKRVTALRTDFILSLREMEPFNATGFARFKNSFPNNSNFVFIHLSLIKKYCICFTNLLQTPLEVINGFP